MQIVLFMYWIVLESISSRYRVVIESLSSQYRVNIESISRDNQNSFSTVSTLATPNALSLLFDALQILSLGHLCGTAGPDTSAVK